MELKDDLKKVEYDSVQRSVQNEYHSQFGAKIEKPGLASLNMGLTRSMLEYELKRFHSRSKKEMVIISNLAREVFLRHRNSEPELVKLVISIYLYFIDYLHYLNIESRFLFPVILDAIPKSNYLGSISSDNKREIQEAIRNIRREQYYAMGKLKSLRKLAGSYLIPVNACRLRKLLFLKMKKFDSALVKYMHFQYSRIFPLVMDGYARNRLEV